MSARRWTMAAAILVALLQIGFLVSMIAGRAAVLRDGREVLLDVEPFDPRDLLRGDYVTLGYNISRLPVGLFAGQAAQDGERVVFVRVRAGEDGVFQPVAARFGHRPEPAPGEGEVDMRGTTRSRWADATQFVSVTYGIERFYVPEGEGRAIEDRVRDRALRMKVAVGRDGVAQIKSLHDGEAMLYAEPLY